MQYLMIPVQGTSMQGMMNPPRLPDNEINISSIPTGLLSGGRDGARQWALVVQCAAAFITDSSEQSNEPEFETRLYRPTSFLPKVLS